MSDENKTDEQQTDAPKAMSPEEINRAITERLRRESAKYEAKLAERDTRYNELLARLEALQTAPASTSPGADSEPKGRATKAEHEEWQKRIKDIEAKTTARINELEAERAKERDAARASEERAELTSALTAAGVVNLKGAMAVLTADKRIGRDEDGRVSFVEPKDGYTDFHSLSDGLKKWLATDEGKFYLPPRGVEGSGSAPNRAAPGKNASKAEFKSHAATVLSDFIVRR